MVYFVCLKISDFDENTIKGLQNRIKIHFSDKVNLKRKESVISKAVICHFAEELFGLNDYFIDCDEKGKPFFVDSYLHFNISHSGEYIVCLIGDEKVGCDVQEVKKCSDNVARRFFSQKEYGLLSGSNRKDEDFALLWTLKESILKLCGDGISGGLSTYDFADFMHKDDFRAFGLHFKVQELPGYIISFCSESGLISNYELDADYFIKTQEGD